MARYQSPQEMFEHRADKYQREGSRQWAMAKNGEGDYHYGLAKESYKRAQENREKAKQAGTSWTR